MLKSEIIKYITQFILKSGEELDREHPTINNFLYDIKIIKRTERTYRAVGQLTISLKDSNTKLKDKLSFTKGKKIKVDDSARKTFTLLEDGWIIKEIRYEKDERTVKSMQYWMGYNYYQLELQQHTQKEEKLNQEFQEIKGNILQIVDTKLFQYLHEKIVELNMDELPKSWKQEKQFKFLYFIHAFLQISSIKDSFDWKEIGANYYQKIGGSKEFDKYKSEFIEQLEEWTMIPLSELGLTSLGQIVPVFFSGELSGRYSKYEYGPVHALTNISIAKEELVTTTTTLWLVENRAILTHMASTNFLQESNSLVLCVDGQVRSAHRNTIKQLLENSTINQVIIWCDYDDAGLIIAREIMGNVSEKAKFILPNQEIVTKWECFEAYMIEFLKTSEMEQEQMMGGVEQWRKWIM